jgi:hypothetical protein
MESGAVAPAAGASSSGTSSSSSSGTPSRAQLKGMHKPNLDALAQVPPATINTISG